jgi:hypothetical protein
MAAPLTELMLTSTRRRQPLADWTVEEINELADRLLNRSVGRSPAAGVSDLRAAARVLRILVKLVPPNKMVVL